MKDCPFPARITSKKDRFVPTGGMPAPVPEITIFVPSLLCGDYKRRSAIKKTGSRISADISATRLSA
jgi:hypothetical protein